MDPVDIRDITAPIAIPDHGPLLVLAALAAVALFLVFLAVRALRRRSGGGLSPEARALSRLAEAGRLLDPACAREFGVAVSTAVRLYIEERFGERAAHRTTEEFLHQLAEKADSPLAARRPLLERFLRHCDLAKFARFALTRDEMEALLASARDLVSPAAEAGPSAR